MNSKVSFINYKFLFENLKKSKGIIILFTFIIPIFSYLAMLMMNSVYSNMLYFPTLSDLSIPVLIGMYIIPFVMAVTLFNFVFKKDSVDFINALPIKRSTIYITNIIGGILVFLFIFLITSLFMFILGSTFNNLVIPSMMYLHYFITFFIAYIFTFIVSCLSLSLTGNRMVHVALTLIILFVPGFIFDFYSSNIYTNDSNNNYYYPTCDKYDEACNTYEIYNNFTIKESLILNNGQTLPYKYVSMVPRSIFGMYNKEVLYQYELLSVYNPISLIKMIILSIIYFGLGLFAFVHRKMEIAESTFKNENIHQLVKCLTLFPLCMVSIKVFTLGDSYVGLLIMIAVISTIYIVYDLITRRNGGNFIKSIIYFVGLALTSLVTYVSLTQIGHYVGNKVVKESDVENIGIAANTMLGNGYSNTDFDIFENKIKDQKIIKLIFDNANKAIANVNDDSKLFAMRTQLKNGAVYYFNVRLKKADYDKMLTLLDKNGSYTKSLKDIPYDNVYGVKLGDVYLNEDSSDKVIALIKEGYKDKSVSEIINASYTDYGKYNEGGMINYSLTNMLYVYKGGIKTYGVNTMINPKLINYVMQTSNERYINDIKKENININQLLINVDIDYTDPNSDKYLNFISDNQELLYRYINDNIKSNIDFSKYGEKEVVHMSVSFNMSNNQSYSIFLPIDDAYREFMKQVEEYTTDNKKVEKSNPNYVYD